MAHSYAPVDPTLLEEPALSLAPRLLGHLLVREEADGTVVAGRIVETEAYTQDDPAFHGWNAIDRETGLVAPKGRAVHLFGPPGQVYIYKIYYTNWLLNVVTEPEGLAGAVLFRAVEPVAGLDRMRERRAAARRDRDLTNGPGKLCQAFGLDGEWMGHPLAEPPLYLARPNGDAPSYPVATSSRIGIRRGVEHPWRFYYDGHPFVSPGTPSDQVHPAKGA